MPVNYNTIIFIAVVLRCSVAAKYRELAIAEATPFVVAMPKWPAASSVRLDKADPSFQE